MSPSGGSSLASLHPRRVEVPLLILLASACLAFGLWMPVLTVHQLWQVNTFSILTGIERLWLDGHRGLAVIVFFFSIIFPITKLAVLAFVWVRPMAEARRRWLLHLLGALGKWSMLDVFVVAVVIVSVKMGAMTKAHARAGVYVFGVSVLLSMFVSERMQGMTRRSLTPPAR